MMTENTTDGEIAHALLEQFDNLYARQVLVAILYLAIMMTIGFMGNALVIYIYVAKLKSSSTTHFVSALASLDLFNCVVNIPFEIADLSHNYTFGTSPLCKVMPLLVTFVSTASGSILVAVAVDRFRKICRPLRRQVTPTMTKVITVICCIFAAVLSLPAAFLYGPRIVKAPENVTGSECSVSDKARQTVLPVVYNAVQFFIFFISTVILIVLYALIWNQVRKQRQFRHAISPNSRVQVSRNASTGCSSDTVTDGESIATSSTDTNMKRKARDNVKFANVTDDITSSSCGEKRTDESETEHSTTTKRQHTSPMTSKAKAKTSNTPRAKEVQKTTLMLFLITLVFVLSFLPYLGLMAATSVNKQLYDGLIGAEVAAYNLFQRSYFINSVSNPIIYSFCSVTFRKHLKLLFKRRFSG